MDLKNLHAWGMMIRPPILFLCCFGAVVGALNTAVFLGENISIFQIIMIILAPAFLSIGTMVHNDVPDLESDKINRPYKPIPSGIISEKTANILGILLMTASIFIALFVNYFDYQTLNWNCAILTAFLVLIGLYYNYYGKLHGIFGHISVAIGVGAIPYWGSIAAFPNFLLVMLPLGIAILIQEIGREIMVCVGDYVGDLKAGWKTTPVKHGREKSMYIALFFYILFIPLYILPAYDYLKIGIPNVFGNLYLIGGTLLALTLIITWILSYRALLTDDEKKIWKAFERYERTGTRAMIVVFQIFIFLEIFY